MARNLIPPPLTCDQVRSNFDAHLRDALDAEKSGRIEGHLQSCDACAGALQEAVRAAFREGIISPSEPPPIPEGILTPLWQKRKVKPRAGDDIIPEAASVAGALPWPQRIQIALQSLAEQGRQTGGLIVSQLQHLAKQTEVRAEAAFEVILDESRKIGEILTDSVESCLGPEAGFRFQHARGPIRTRGVKDQTQKSSIGIFHTSHVPSAKLITDVQSRTITVEFSQSHPALLMVLVPQDLNIFPIQKSVEKSQSFSRVIFNNVPFGTYALVLYPYEPRVESLERNLRDVVQKLSHQLKKELETNVDTLLEKIRQSFVYPTPSFAPIFGEHSSTMVSPFGKVFYPIIFEWRPVKEADGYVISVPVVNWSYRTRSTRLEVSLEELRLDDGQEYSWEMKVMKDGKVLSRQTGYFSLATQKDVEKFEAVAEEVQRIEDEPEQLIIWGLLLEDQDLFMQAITKYTLAYDMTADPGIAYLIACCYEKLELEELQYEWNKKIPKQH